MTTTTQRVEPVGGLISRDLVARIVGDHPIELRGPGARTPEQRRAEPANLAVRDAETHHTVLSVLIGEYPRPATLRMLDAEADGDPDCTKRYEGEPGDGYGSIYTHGALANGAAVHVLRRDRLIRVTVTHWPSASPEERLALAEQVATDIDANLTAFDGSLSS